MGILDGFIGKVVFLDRLQPKQTWKTESYGLEKDNAPYLISCITIGAYEGAMPEPNPILNLKIRRKFIVRDGKLIVSFELVNPTKKEMPLQFRLNNHPWPGFRFGTKNIVLNGKYGPQSPQALTRPDQGETLTLKAEDNGLSDEITFQSKTPFEKVFFWTHKLSSRKTVEYTVDRKLAPGAALKLSYEVQVK